MGPRTSRRARLSATVAGVLALLGCSPSHDGQTLHFSRGATEVRVTYLGEVSDTDVFGASGSLLDTVQPVDEFGRPRQGARAPRPGWLRFDYAVDGERHEVLVAKQPLMNFVSWDDIARAGGATSPEAGGGDGHAVARIKDQRGDEYIVRLPTCGRSTLGDLSEWNLLIGAAHRGDMDFTGPTYGWIRDPLDDDDLEVGFHGSLSWCQDVRGTARVARGYFFVSRFHVAPPHLRTDRLMWRPVLERVVDRPAAARAPPGVGGAPVTWSPSGRVGFAGAVRNVDLFGPGGRIDKLLGVTAGSVLDTGQPDWLRFVFEDKTLLVAAKPVRYALSWDAIAQAGAALGDGSRVRQGWRFHPQTAEVTGLDGTRYRVRLMDCGSATLDSGSEWNALLGGVHRGDGDFVRYPAGVYGWLAPPFDDESLHIGYEHASAAWCRNTLEIDGDLYGVNRGYLTVSRFHATPTGFAGAGFGWRPVLEAIP